MVFIKDFKGKSITVFGAGRTGIGVAKKLYGLGAEVTVTEERPQDEIEDSDLLALRSFSSKLEFGGHTLEGVMDADLIVLSPGVHLDLPVLKEAKRLKIPIISEIELAYMFLKKPIIGVTGTNGKTTTVTLISEILKHAGYGVIAAGNIGYPLISVDDSKAKLIVAEISSYQLEGIINFKPWISVILNITEDHLERHHKMEEYVKAKGRIFLNQGKEDLVIYNADDKRVSKLVKRAKGRLLPFSRKEILREGVYVENGKIFSATAGGKTFILKSREIALLGEHNLENVLAAIAVGIVCKAPMRAISEVLKEFNGVEHRIEYVTTIDKVAFYNDSKGTNPDSTIAALKALSGDREQGIGNRNIVLIAGGRDKGGDLREMCKFIKDTTKHVVLIGEASNRFNAALKEAGYQNVTAASSMEEAVKVSLKLSAEGDIVLLSPACASFDMFKDFEERGKVFKEIVKNLSHA